ncbi:MAG: hypothetical protein NTV25_09870 [Methanothrix sp.]|nr:hypothetical protein [Methanothrix sp.]
MAVDSEKNLVEILANHRWPLCMGFEFDDILYRKRRQAGRTPRNTLP